MTFAVHKFIAGAGMEIMEFSQAANQNIVHQAHAIQMIAQHCRTVQDSTPINGKIIEGPRQWI